MSYDVILDLAKQVEAFSRELPFPDVNDDEAYCAEYFLRQKFCFSLRNKIFGAVMAFEPNEREGCTMPELTEEQIEDILSRGEFAAADAGITREEAEAERQRQIEKRIAQLEASHPFRDDPTWPVSTERLINKALFYVLNGRPNKDFELRLMHPFTEWDHSSRPRSESIQVLIKVMEELVRLLPADAIDRIADRRHRSLMHSCRHYPQHDDYLAPHLSENDRKRKLAESAGLKGKRPKS